jgi:1-acyl-sn-glycerol-3-phosphate acyltransferase
MQRLVTAWVWTLWVLVVLVGFPFVTVVFVCTAPFDPGRYAAGRVFRWFGALGARLNPWWHFRTEGLMVRDPRRPYVAVSNHESYADIFLISHLPWEMKWLAKKTIFKIPVMGWIMRMAGDVPLVRGDRQSALGAIARCQDRLTKRVSVDDLPRGARARPSPEMLAVQGRRFHLPCGAQVPLLPSPRRTRDCMAKHSFRVNRARAACRVLARWTPGLTPTTSGAARPVRALIDAARASSPRAGRRGRRPSAPDAPARPAPARGAPRVPTPPPPPRRARRPGDGDPPRTVDALEERLSRPTGGVRAALERFAGDVVVLGAGGKMGPSLARMARRALDELGGPHGRRRVVAVSRWADPAAGPASRRQLEGWGVETAAADLLDQRALAALPDAPLVVYMAGLKFGTADSPARMWATNTVAPALVAERYAGARIVAFSTGNVYPLTAAPGRGAAEDHPLTPLGEYGNACVARERVLEWACARHASPLALVRLSYAVDLRYGVLVDVAERVRRDEPWTCAPAGCRSSGRATRARRRSPRSSAPPTRRSSST